MTICWVKSGKSHSRQKELDEEKQDFLTSPVISKER
jgi:hypothetical protein